MEDKRNSSFLAITFLLISAMPAYNCIMYLLRVAGINIPLRMLHIYLVAMLFLAVLLMRYKLPVKSLGAIFIIFGFYGINFLCASEETRKFYYSTDVAALLAIFTPIACLITSQVNKWDDLFTNKFFLSVTDGIILLSLLSKISQQNSSGYMSFSYDLLPLWGICLISALFYGNNVQWLFFCVGLFEGFFYGARGPLCWIVLLAAVLLIIIWREDNEKRKQISILTAVFMLGGIIIVALLPAIFDSALADASYVLRRLKLGSLFGGAGRGEIYSECRKILKDMGFSVNGLFYDRTVLPNAWYSHNFIYEVLISLGWILGVLYLAGLAYIIISTFIKQNTSGKVMVSYFCCSFFFRYFLSGSIFDEPEFVLFLAAVFSLNAQCSNMVDTKEKVRPTCLTNQMEIDDMLEALGKVSVIIPTYGGSASLNRSIDSVLKQEYSDYEIIVVDDNNPDTEARVKTEKMMSKYVSNYKVKYLKHEFNKNGSAARNTGYRASNGEFLCFLDDDDAFLPDKIKKQVEYMNAHLEYGACYCWRNQRGKIISGSYTGDLRKEILDLTFTPTTSAVMIRRSCYSALNGFDESYRRHQDFEFLLRFFEVYSMGVVEEVLLDFIGNEVNNQLRGKKLYDVKEQFFAQFSDDIERLDKMHKGFKKRVFAAHFSDACKELIRYGNFWLAVKMYVRYGTKGGLLFWKYFFEKVISWVKRKTRREA